MHTGVLIFMVFVDIFQRNLVVCVCSGCKICLFLCTLYAEILGVFRICSSGNQSIWTCLMNVMNEMIFLFHDDCAWFHVKLMVYVYISINLSLKIHILTVFMNLLPQPMMNIEL